MSIRDTLKTIWSLFPFEEAVIPKYLMDECDNIDDLVDLLDLFTINLN